MFKDECLNVGYWGKGRTPRKTPKIPTLCTSIVPLMTLILKLVVVVVVVVVVVDLRFTTLLTSQIIRAAFYSEREKSDKFCSEALISA